MIIVIKTKNILTGGNLQLGDFTKLCVFCCHCKPNNQNIVLVKAVTTVVLLWLSGFVPFLFYTDFVGYFHSDKGK